MKTPSLKGKAKGPLKFAMILAFIILVCFALQITPVADQISKMTGYASDKIKSTAKTVALICIGLALVTWGIAALSVPILGGAMIVVGLVFLAWVLYPLFVKSPGQTTAASFDSTGPLKVFG